MVAAGFFGPAVRSEAGLFRSCTFEFLRGGKLAEQRCTKGNVATPTSGCGQIILGSTSVGPVAWPWRCTPARTWLIPSGLRCKPTHPLTRRSISVIQTGRIIPTVSTASAGLGVSTIRDYLCSQTHRVCGETNSYRGVTIIGRRSAWHSRSLREEHARTERLLNQFLRYFENFDLVRSLQMPERNEDGDCGNEALETETPQTNIGRYERACE